jgi:hypothetical protein
MDTTRVLMVLRPGEKWGVSQSADYDYAKFAAAWRGDSACPTREEMDAAWNTIQAADAVLMDENAIGDSLRLEAIQILKTEVPNTWKTDPNPQRRIAWAFKRLFVDVRQELKERD